MKLGVNIDHIATIRQARRAEEPDPVYAAVYAEAGGADGITVHLRQDRRHIQDRDVDLLRRTIKTRLNLEMAVTMDMVRTALRFKPHVCTLVPESPEEITTTGGLDVILLSEKIEEVASHLRADRMEVSLFIDPVADQIKACHRLNIRAIELNTGAFAEAFGGSMTHLELEKLVKAAQLARKLNIRVLAGHGLTYRNVHPIVRIPEIEELNIGHSIVANASLWGMTEAVARMKRLIQR
jgi:pyridoxine 5-phosphate synthase